MWALRARRSLASDRGHYSLLAAVIAVGTVTRVIDIGNQPLWSDEGLTLVLTEWSAHSLLFTPVDATGPLYYLLHKLLLPDGASVAVIRSISLAAGITAILAMYALGRLCLERRAALLVAAMLSVSPPLVDYSQEARSYSVLVLLVLLSACGLNGWIRHAAATRPSTAYLGLFTVSTLLAFYTHLTAVFWIIPSAAGGAWLTLRRGSSQAMRLYVLSAALMAVLALPEMNRLIAASKAKIGFTWLNQADLPLFLETVADAWLPTPPWQSSWRSETAIGLLVVAALMIGWRLWRQSRQLRTWADEFPAGALTICVLVSAPVWIWLFGLVARPIFMPRSILITVPGFLLLVGLVIQIDRRWRTGLVVLGLYVGVLLVGGTTRQKEDWTAVSRVLESGVRAGDIVVICPEWKYPAFRHALGTAVPAPLLLPFGKDVQLLERRLGLGSDFVKDFHEIGFSRTGWSSRQVSLPVFSRVWLVTSECRNEESLAIREWIGASRWRRAAAVPDTRYHKGIAVWLVDRVPLRHRPVVEFNREIASGGQH